MISEIGDQVIRPFGLPISGVPISAHRSLLSSKVGTRKGLLCKPFPPLRSGSLRSGLTEQPLSEVRVVMKAAGSFLLKNLREIQLEEMMLKNLRTYNLSVQFYKACLNLKLPGYLRNQLLRASSSITLNVSEGYGRSSAADKKRFYSIALGSLRECQSVFDLAEVNSATSDMADHLGGCLYKLIQAT